MTGHNCSSSSGIVHFNNNNCDRRYSSISGSWASQRRPRNGGRCDEHSQHAFELNHSLFESAWFTGLGHSPIERGKQSVSTGWLSLWKIDSDRFIAETTENLSINTDIHNVIRPMLLKVYATVVNSTDRYNLLCK